MLPARRRVLVVIVVMTLALPLLVLGPATSTAADACRDLQRLQGVGLVCPMGEGSYEVFSPEGVSQGFTHGPDLPRASPPEGGSGLETLASGSAPSMCVDGAPGSYFIHVIYARALDDADRYAAQLLMIRREVAKANGLVDDAAQATGDRVSLRIQCDGADIRVEDEVLPTSMASADFSTIVRDLRAIGYDDPRQKYLVYYDDASVCACLGIGHFYQDESNSPDNLNNAGPSSLSMFAVVFDSPDVQSFLHELGHTMGAVQDGAPYSTLAGHCYDGRDTMCYNDGGPRGTLYSVNYCATQIFDCGRNTYCNAYPEPGSYLATRWQACSRLSRFLTYPANAPPVVQSVVCAPAPSFPEEDVTCTFRANDTGPRLKYVVDWGDGASTTVPATGTVPSGVTQNATYRYLSQGTRIIRIVATDIGYPPLSSAPYDLAQEVMAANEAPRFDPLVCTPPAPAEGDLITCTVSATDEDRMFFTLQWGDGSASVRLPASGWALSGQPQSTTHRFVRGGEYLVNVTVQDDGRKPSSRNMTTLLAVEEINTAPVMRTINCGPARPFPNKPEKAAGCEFRADDDSSGVYYTIDWGDGTVKRVPPVGHAAPGVLQNQTHVYTADGEYTFLVHATDSFSPPATSTVSSALFRVMADQQGPSILMREPKPGSFYLGCSKLEGATNSSLTPIFFQRGCMRVIVADASGVKKVVVLRGLNGESVLGTSLGEPWTVEFAIPALEANAVYRIRAYDNVGNTNTIIFTAHSFQGGGS